MAAFAGKRQMRLFHIRHCLPQRRVKALPPMIRANAVASIRPKIRNSFLTSQKTSLNAVLTIQATSLKSSRTNISSGNKYIRSNNSNIKINQYKMTILLCKYTKNQRYTQILQPVFSGLSNLFPSIYIPYCQYPFP